ncbi:8223_t:CDS:2 [Ambispora leptoticha]|uniref:8223_t:CDS:1 n=1 Tax=Ambispora leptoticha TaxID=144679 RepID=A0A9N9NQJ8_9GLOM|nr:8223_t:CDS:2 [Ambispora leptoticha]
MAPPYRQANSINKTIDQIDNKVELDEFLNLFIAWLTKIDGKPFKVESINNFLKPFKIPTNDPEKIKLYKYHQRMPLKKATNKIILQLPKSDKPLNITLNISLNN